MSRLKKLSRIEQNMLTGLLGQLVTILVGFLLPRLFLTYYGSGVNGELNTIKQLFAYLYLLEAGVGLATTQALYRPVALEEHDRVNAILSATDHYYRRTGTLYAAIVLAVGLFYPMVVQFSLPRSTILLYTVLYGLPSVVSFFVQGKYRLLMDVDGRSYVLNNLNIAVQLVSGIGKVAVLVFTQNILAMQLLYCLSSMLPIPFILWYVHKNYPWLDRHAAPDYAAVSQKGSVLLHQISSVIFNNTDMVLLSYFCNFALVSVYSIYNMFFVQISNILNLLINSGSFRLGQIFQTDRKRFSALFEVYETVYLAFVSFCATMTAAFLLPVIRIYTGGVTDINYLDPLLLLLFSSKSLVECGKNIYHQVIQYDGSFQQTRWHAVVEMTLNLLVTLIAIQFCGIYGCLFGTLAALVFRLGAILWYTCRRVLHRRILPVVWKWVRNLAAAALVLRLLGLQSRPELGFWGVVGIAFVHMFWVAGVFLLVNLLAEPTLLRRLRGVFAKTI